MTTNVRLLLEVDGEQFEVFTQKVDHTSVATPAPEAKPAPKPRGRPAKGEAPAAPAAATVSAAATVVTGVGAGAATTSPSDPFATAPAAPAATLDDVRAALTALRAATSQEKALGLLKTVGGAENLTSLAAEKYGLVVANAKQAIAATQSVLGATPAADPFAEPAPVAVATQAPAPVAQPSAAPITIEDVKAAVVDATKRTAADTVQKVVMQHGGKAPLPSGGEGPSIKAIPPANYAAVIAAVKALPATK